ncbi:biopolymer transporter ExbD [Prosthecobacter sp.]|uniref:ExbD/TolR family protein n=1 Tax=Prosthecobacter sp. TaxID=1965333 RepID=UPI002ABA5317|nr:biopolymer transporter ExbD [Prosthecobacter sp.]MDZ4405865.1 biopolymer transporter ExbD [Prosthecobacter sp.]
MAKKKRFVADQVEDPSLDISSLIDVSFLLLIYFLVTSTLEPRESDLSMEMPTDSGKASSIQIDPLKIRLTAAGQVTIADQVMADDGQMESELDRYKQLTDATNKKPLVIVSSDDEAKQQRFIDLMNALAKVGITTITLSGFEKGK